MMIGLLMEYLLTISRIKLAKFHFDHESQMFFFLFLFLYDLSVLFELNVL